MQSLIKHIDDVRIFLADNPVDVLAINESKLDDSIKSCELYIPGYEITRRDRNRNGGGVCFCIKTSINFVICRDLNLNDLENLCLEIQKPYALSHSSWQLGIGHLGLQLNFSHTMRPLSEN